MKFKDLAIYLEKLEKENSRIEITKILADLFKASSSDEIDKIIYLLLGGLAPSYENVVFNLAERMMLQVLSRAYDLDLNAVKKLYKLKGDLGGVAQEISKKKEGTLTVNEVYNALLVLAKDEGEGSQDRKIMQMAALMSKLDSLSAKFVARIPVGKLRLGFSDKTILDALSWMENGDKSGKAELEKAYQLTPDVASLAKKVKLMGIKKASRDGGAVVGIPILPMLAQRLNSPSEMIKKMGEVAVEPKFDGLRVLIHYKKGEGVVAFTRNLNNITDMFPELQSLKKYVKADSLILDSEAIGLDPQTKKMVDFQMTMKRRRKHDIKRFSGEIPARFVVFDILYKNGKSLMQDSYIKRREVLNKTITRNSLFEVDEFTKTKSPEMITQKHKEMLELGLEGVIVKKLDAQYIPGRTGWRWVKMKEAEGRKGKISDTIDCIIMGYGGGRGRRADFGIGQFLAGIRDGEEIKTLTKVGTGLTDKQFKDLGKRLKKIVVSEKPKEYKVHKDLEPDSWVLPKVVVELAGDELTISPKHTSSLALRFPRLVRFRDDKGIAEATTISEVKALFKLQKKA